MPDDLAFGAGHWMKSPFQANNETVVSHVASVHVLLLSMSAQLCCVCIPIWRVVSDSNYEEIAIH